MTTFPTRRGEFNLLRKIGEGGMAEVFLAERGGDEGFKTLVALKRLHGGFALDQYFIRQLVQEAKLLGQLQHNNIVRVHDLRRIADEYFIVMEYIDGIDLAQAIHVHRDNDLRFPLSIFFHIALCLCEALEFAHSAVDLTGKPIRLIHRDIKPSNVLIHHRGIVKLTDFGIARVGDTSNTGSVVKGTANYMSPEQASGAQSLTPASDIFSVGAVFWEMLTLEKLVDGNNYLNVINSIKELNVGLKDITKKGIEPGLRMILLRMLARKRELRYQNMGLVLKDLRFVAEQMKVDLSPSHLREYMAKITNLAREAAARMAEAQNIAAQDPDAPTPVPAAESRGGGHAGAPPGLRSRDSQPHSIPPGALEPALEKEETQERAFAESVAALKKLVQSSPEASPVEGPPPPVLPVPPAQTGPKTGDTPSRSGRPPSRPRTLTPSSSYVGPGPRRSVKDSRSGAASVRTSPPMKAVPAPPRPSTPPPVVDPSAAAPPSAVGLRAVDETDVTEDAGFVPGQPVPSPSGPPPKAPAPRPVVRRNTNSTRARAATAEVEALIRAKKEGKSPPLQAETTAATDPGREPPQGQSTPPGARQAAASTPPTVQAPPPVQAPQQQAPPPVQAQQQAPPRAPAPAPASPAAVSDVFPPQQDNSWVDDSYYDDDDEEDYYAAVRRTNMLVLGAGVAAALLILGLIAMLWVTPAEEGGPSEVAAEGAATTTAGAPAPKGLGVGVEIAEADPEPATAAPAVASSDGGASTQAAGTRTSRGSGRDLSEQASTRRSETRSSETRSSSTRREQPTSSRSSAGVSRSTEPEPSSSTRTSRTRSSTRSEPAASRSSASTASSTRSSSSSSSSSSRATSERSSSRSSSTGASSSYSIAGISRDDSEDEEDDWVGAGEGSRASLGDSEPVADSGSSEGEALSRDILDGMTETARRGRLTSDEIRRLEAVRPGSESFNQSRAALLAQFEAVGDRAAHCSVAGEALDIPRNSANPQFHLEMGKCHLRQGRYRSALDSARVAELNAQDIPSRIRTDRQLKIWEVQAKAYKGLYQGSDDLDYIDDSIAVWGRYRHLAENTYRSREAERAVEEIRSLRELRDGAL